MLGLSVWEKTGRAGTVVNTVPMSPQTDTITSSSGRFLQERHPGAARVFNVAGAAENLKSFNEISPFLNDGNHCQNKKCSKYSIIQGTNVRCIQLRGHQFSTSAIERGYSPDVWPQTCHVTSPSLNSSFCKIGIIRVGTSQSRVSITWDTTRGPDEGQLCMYHLNLQPGIQNKP